MNVLEQLTEDMKASMKAGDVARTGVLRLLRAAMKNEEIKLGHPLSEVEALKVLQREAKQRRDSIAAYQAAGRSDLVQAEESEQKVIAGYLPPAMDETELLAIIAEEITRLGATDQKQLGMVMGAVTARVGARAEGGTIARLVREQLTGSGR